MWWGLGRRSRYSQTNSPFYPNRSTLPASSNQQALLGLSLLRLLSSNAIASFHTTLETLPTEMVRDSPYLQHPVNLERWLMEGSYSKVWRSRDQVPMEEFKFFVDGLMLTIRHEIASCEEKAYDSLPLNDAATLLFFDNMQQVSSFANEVSCEVRVRVDWQAWVLTGNVSKARMANQPEHTDGTLPYKDCNDDNVDE